MLAHRLAHGGRGPREGHCRPSVSCIDNAEPVALGIRQDHVVSIHWLLVPEELDRTEPREPRHLRGLLAGAEIEMDSRRNVCHGCMKVKLQIRAYSCSRAQHSKVAARLVPRDVAEHRGPKGQLTWQVVYAHHNRAHSDHDRKLSH